MKKALALAAALTLALTLPTAAFAAELGPGQMSGTADVTLDVSEMFYVTIPSEINLTKQQDGSYAANETVSITNAKLDRDGEVKVTLISDFLLTDSNNSDNTWQYTVTVGDNTIQSGDTVATFTSTKKENATLLFAASNPTYAGKYTDTVTFNIAYTADVTVGHIDVGEWGEGGGGGLTTD